MANWQLPKVLLKPLGKNDDPFEVDITNMLVDYKEHGMVKDGKVDFVNAAMVIQGVNSIICKVNVFYFGKTKPVNSLFLKK